MIRFFTHLFQPRIGMSPAYLREKITTEKGSGLLSKMIFDLSLTITGWWFGCHFLFSHILGISSSQLTNSYFSEGWPNHQPEKCRRLRDTSSANVNPNSSQAHLFEVLHWFASGYWLLDIPVSWPKNIDFGDIM